MPNKPYSMPCMACPCGRILIVLYIYFHVAFAFQKINGNHFVSWLPAATVYDKISNKCVRAGGTSPFTLQQERSRLRIGHLRHRKQCLAASTGPEEAVEDHEAAILAWKKVEKVLTEKARAEARARAEQKANAMQNKRSAKPIIIWDVMNTICYDPFYKEVPAYFKMSLDDLYAAKNSKAWEDFELGKISQEETLATFFRDRRQFDHAKFVDAVTSRYEFLDGMEALLDELFIAGYNMHAMSNYPVWWKQLEERLQLSRFLKWTFVSCEAGVRKPDPASYSAVIRHLGDVPPERCILIDDSERNVAAARDAGWQAIQFSGCEALRRELLLLGVKLEA